MEENDAAASLASAQGQLHQVTHPYSSWQLYLATTALVPALFYQQVNLHMSCICPSTTFVLLEITVREVLAARKSYFAPAQQQGLSERSVCQLKPLHGPHVGNM